VRCAECGYFLYFLVVLLSMYVVWILCEVRRCFQLPVLFITGSTFLLYIIIIIIIIIIAAAIVVVVVVVVVVVGVVVVVVVTKYPVHAPV
jgi:hypothetical protein